MLHDSALYKFTIAIYV